MKIELVDNWTSLWKSYTFAGLVALAMSPEIYSIVIELLQLWGLTTETAIVNQHLSVAIKSAALITALGRAIKQKSLEIKPSE